MLHIIAQWTHTFLSDPGKGKISELEKKNGNHKHYNLVDKVDMKLFKRCMNRILVDKVDMKLFKNVVWIEYYRDGFSSVAKVMEKRRKQLISNSESYLLSELAKT